MKKNLKIFLFAMICIIGVACFFSFAIQVTARHSINTDKALEEFDETINAIEDKALQEEETIPD